MAAIFQIRRGDETPVLADGELFLNKTSGSLIISNGENNEIILAKLNDVNSGSFNVSGDITLGGTITIGDTTNDSVIFNADLSSSIIPDATNTYDLGASSKLYRNVYATSGSFTHLVGLGSVSSINTRIGDLEWTGSNHEGRVDLLETAMSGSKRLYVSPEGIDTNDGTEPHKPFKTIKAAVESLGSAIYTNTKRYTIFVGSGEYEEQNPIAVPPGVAIVGDTLRTVRLTAANPTKDFFHVHDSNYFYGLRFLDLKHPAFAFSFPASTATSTISGGSVSTISVVHSMTGYTDGNNQNIGIIIEGPDVSGSIATATANVVGGVITQINVVSGGTNYVNGEKPHISIPAPLAKRPVITTSPYVQNCSSITGPFNTSGVKVLQALPYDEATFNIDEHGAGGGIRIDGNLVHPLSPLESFVADAFTQVNQGGPGHLVINKGYAQFVSCFTTFCTYGFKTANGGFANISNSVIDFGAKGLISKTYYPQTYNTGSSLETKTSQVSGFIIFENGAGYTGSVAGVTIVGGGASVQATAEATINANGSIDEIVLLTPGSGYTSQPNVTIDAPTGPGAIPATTVAGRALISGVGEMLMSLESGSRGIDISSNMLLNGVDYLVTDVAEVGGQPNQRRITTYPAPPSILTNDQIYFYQLSNISTGGLVMEYVGSGVTYNALPKYGGVPIRTREINEFAPGRVFYTTVDNIGNLKIGDFFSVNQLTGEVTIDANSFNLSGLNAIGPFRRNGVAVGVVLQEVSNNTTLLNSQGLHGEDTVPTQYAVYEFVSAFSASLDSRIDNVEIFTASIKSTNEFTASAKSRLNNLEIKSASFDVSVAALNNYTSALNTAIELTGSTVSFLGDIIVYGTQSVINSVNLEVADNMIYLNATSSTTNVDLGIVGNYNDGTYAHTGIYRDATDGVWRVFKGYTNEPEGNINLTDPSFQLADFYANEISASVKGIGNVTEYSTSVNSRLITLDETGSKLDVRLDNLEIKTGSFENRFNTIETHTGSVNTKLAAIGTFTASIYGTNTWTASINTKNETLSLYTASLETKFTTLRNVTSSLQTTTASLNLFTASIFNTNEFTASATASIVELFWTASNHEGRLDLLEIASASINVFTQSANSRLNNLEGISASFSTWTGSTYSTFSTSVDSRLDNVEYLANLGFGGLDASLLAINTATASLQSFTASINTTIKTKLDADGVLSGSSQVVGLLNSLNAVSASLISKTGSYATTGSNTFNGTQTINGGITTGFSAPSVDGYSLASMFVFKRSGGDGGANIRVGQGAAGYGIFGQDNNGDVVLGTVAGSQGDKPIRIYTNSANEGLTLTNQRVLINATGVSVTGTITGTSISGQILANNGVISGSSQITSILPAGVVSGSSQITYANISSIPSGIVSGSSQVTTLLPTGVVSGSSQINLTATTNYSTGIKTRLDAETVVSGSKTISGITLGSNLATLTIGTGLSGTSYNGSGAVTIANTGVTSITGTSNQVITSGGSGGVTLSLPQSIATTSNVTFANVYATSDVIAYYTSDKRHKNNIQIIPNALEKISKLNGVTWEWNDDVSEFTKLTPTTGLIAQEVQEVLPEVVKEKEDGFLGLDYSRMMGLMVEAMKEQQTQIHSLTLELEKLKKNNSL